MQLTKGEHKFWMCTSVGWVSTFEHTELDLLVLNLFNNFIPAWYWYWIFLKAFIPA
jgi:hypothetical protein